MNVAAHFIAAVVLSLSAAANDPAPFRQGELLLRTGTDQASSEVRYRLKDERLRIDQPGEVIPAPAVNLLDLASGTLRILHPHNGTWQEVESGKLSPARPGLPGPQAGVGPRQGPVIAPPALPAIPRMPDPGRVPLMPPPVLPILQAGTPELKDTGEERRIHGYACVRHTITFAHDGEMSLWLAAPGMFPPFHLLASDVPERQSRDPFAQVPALLREKNRFPLLAEWKGKDGSVINRWEVVAITPDIILDASLFEVPESFQRIDGP